MRDLPDPETAQATAKAVSVDSRQRAFLVEVDISEADQIHGALKLHHVVPASSDQVWPHGHVLELFCFRWVKQLIRLGDSELAFELERVGMMPRVIIEDLFEAGLIVGRS